MIWPLHSLKALPPLVWDFIAELKRHNDDIVVASPGIEIEANETRSIF